MNSRVVVRLAVGALLVGTILQFTLVRRLYGAENPHIMARTEPSGGVILDPSFYVNGGGQANFEVGPSIRSSWLV